MARRTVLMALFSLLAAGIALRPGRAMATEEPRHEVISRWEGVELRRYAPSLVAETRVTGSRDAASVEGFRRLARYIFGDNRPRGGVAVTAAQPQTIAMTAPVAVAPSEASEAEAWTVQFTMPAAWTLDTLPAPNDARVAVLAVPERLVLALAYRGSWSDARREANEATLLAIAAREGLEVRGPLTWARYDPPWMPWFLKRNEVWVEVASASGS
jgi:hypothetical protein